jgi:hypothetical protein
VKPITILGPALEQRAAEDPQRAGREHEQHEPEHDVRHCAAGDPRERFAAAAGARHEPREQPIHALEGSAHEAADQMRDEPAGQQYRDRGEDHGQIGDETLDRVAEHGDELCSPGP